MQVAHRENLETSERIRLIQTAEGSSRPKQIRVGGGKVPSIKYNAKDFVTEDHGRRHSTGAKNPKYKVGPPPKANTDRYASQVRNGIQQRNTRRSFPLNVDIERFGQSGGESSPGEYRKNTDINMFAQQTSFLENSIESVDGMNRKTSRVFVQRKQDPRKKV